MVWSDKVATTKTKGLPRSQVRPRDEGGSGGEGETEKTLGTHGSQSGGTLVSVIDRMRRERARREREKMEKVGHGCLLSHGAAGGTLCRSEKE